MDDHVDHAVRQQVLGALEAVRQLLADGLLDDARAGEADQRAGLCDVDVAEHGVAGGDAARGRVGQDDDVRQARLAQALYGDGCARHLHQRHDAFLHARAARGREQDEGCLGLDRMQHAGDDRLTGGHAERPGHEAEVLGCGDDGAAVDRALADENGVIELGLGAGVLEAVGVALAVAELQRIGGNGRYGHLGVGAAVEDVGQALRRAHALVIVRARIDELVGFQILVKHHLPRLGALAPKIVRYLALRRQEAADLGADDVVDPVHGVPSLLDDRRSASVIAVIAP